MPDGISGNIQFGFVVLCFLVALAGRKSKVSRGDYLFLAAAMFFTVLSDLFIIKLSANRIGVTTFCAAQLIYFARHTRGKYLAFCPLVLIPAAMALFIQRSYLVFISAVYAQCLLLSVSSAVTAFLKNKIPAPNKFLILIGILLFGMCDVCVAVFNLNVLGIESGLSAPAGGLIWFFYAPSQLLLALSARKFRRKNSA